MWFETEGPYELYRRKGLINRDAAARRYYWQWVNEYVSGLPEACGCYIFAIQTPRGTLPWYVGKAANQSFRQECLTAHKINHFNDALAGRRGKPVLFFLPQVRRNGEYRWPAPGKRPAIGELESVLMGMALTRNPALLNTQGTKFMRNLTVQGFINSRKASAGPAASLRAMLNP